MIDDTLRDAVDDYLDDRLDEAGMRTLEQRLSADSEAMAYFVRMHDLHRTLREEVRARSAGDRAVAALPGNNADHRTRRRFGRLLMGSAALIAALAAGWIGSRMIAPVRSAAWLVNAHDCEWSSTSDWDRELRRGSIVELKRGFAELRFQSGASVILDGPSRFEVLGPNRGRLWSGRIAARVPESAIGFEVLSPQGKVIDLGTEFGVDVAADGSTDVVVFEGMVDAVPRDGDKVRINRDERMSLADNRGSRPVDSKSVGFVRNMESARRPRAGETVFDFVRPLPGTLQDREGRGIGLTTRLAGTGNAIPERDPNLHLNPAGGLELTTTNSDINRAVNLDRGEYFGVKLADYGFTGKEDFEVAAEFPAVPALRRVGQFGVYVGTAADCNIRGGLISKDGGEYTQFLVNNLGGIDANSGFNGTFASGEDLRITLRRIGGLYSAGVENPATRDSCTLTIKHPAFLDDRGDLQVGIFGANTRSEVSKVLVIRSLKVTVWSSRTNDRISPKTGTPGSP